MFFKSPLSERLQDASSDFWKTVLAEFRQPRACLKKAFCKMCVTICGRFLPDEGAGMSGMAVVSAIMKAEDPKKNARELKEKIVALMGK